PLWGIDAFDHDGLRGATKLDLVLFGEVFAGVHDNRKLIVPRIFLHVLDQLEASHVREPQVEHHAVERLLADRGESLFTRRDGDRLDVVVADELDNTVALDFVVLDYEQLSRGLLDKGFEAAEGGLKG